jgi:transcriptional regulator with XRE-family HTH domain
MEKEKKMTFGDKVKQRKEEMRLSNNELGRRVDLSGQAIADIINGKTVQPKIETVVKLSKALEVPLGWLAEGIEAFFNRNLDEEILKYSLNEGSIEYGVEIEQKQSELFDYRESVIRVLAEKLNEAQSENSVLRKEIEALKKTIADNEAKRELRKAEIQKGKDLLN